jgi:hypothetical protein
VSADVVVFTFNEAVPGDTLQLPIPPQRFEDLDAIDACLSI